MRISKIHFLILIKFTRDNIDISLNIVPLSHNTTMCPQKAMVSIPLRFFRVVNINRLVYGDQMCYQINRNHAVMFIEYRIT